ncbi:MAG: hypothetical protein V5B34_15600 [Accumulibacter sp.]|jgi:hypothetical protein
MPTLNWIGKEAVVKHHKEVPFRLLEPVPTLSCGDSGSGNGRRFVAPAAEPEGPQRCGPVRSLRGRA